MEAFKKLHVLIEDINRFSSDKISSKIPGARFEVKLDSVRIDDIMFRVRVTYRDYTDPKTHVLINTIYSIDRSLVEYTELAKSRVTRLAYKEFIKFMLFASSSKYKSDDGRDLYIICMKDLLEKGLKQSKKDLDDTVRSRA